MPDPILARLASLWRSRRVGFILAGLLLIVGTPFLGYYVVSYYSVSGVSVQIVSATRTLGSPIEYRLDIRVSSPGAVMLVRLWRPSMTLTLDSYNLAGVSPYTPAYSSGDWNHLNPGDSLTYRGLWRSSNALDPSAEQTLSQTKTNDLLLYVYFHRATAGWYNNELSRSISATWTWSP